MTTEWELIDDAVDGQTIALYRNQHGDEIEVRDTYPNPVQLMTPREDRFHVVYDKAGRVPMVPPRGRAARVDTAFAYAVETIMGDDLTGETVPEPYRDLVLGDRR